MPNILYELNIVFQLENSRQQETDKASLLQKEIKEASNKVQVGFSLVLLLVLPAFLDLDFPRENGHKQDS